MLPDVRIMIAALVLVVAVLIFLSPNKKKFYTVCLSLLVSLLALDTVFALQVIPGIVSFVAQDKTNLWVLIICIASSLFLRGRKTNLDLTLDFLVIFPLLVGLLFVEKHVAFFWMSTTVLSLGYYQVIKGESGARLKQLTQGVYLEVFLLLAISSLAQYTINSQPNFLHLVCIILIYLYILIQAPLLIGLSGEKLCGKKLISMALPKTVIVFKLIYIAHEIFHKLTPQYQADLSAFTYGISLTLLVGLSLKCFLVKNEEKYSRVYVIAQFTTLASVYALDALPESGIFLYLVVLDCVVSYCTIQLFRRRESSLWSFVIQTTLVPISISFFAKIILFRALILESGFHPFGYAVVVNQVCLSVCALVICSRRSIGKFDLPLGHALYLSCAIISACLMVIIP